MFHENIIKNDTNHKNYDMYTTMSQSYVTYLLRFEEASISEVLVWQCNIKTMQNPTNIVDLYPSTSGQEVYLSRER